MSAISEMLETRDVCEAMGLRAAFIDCAKSFENPFNAYTEHERFAAWRTGFSVLEAINNDADTQICKIEDDESEALDQIKHEYDLVVDLANAEIKALEKKISEVELEILEAESDRHNYIDAAYGNSESIADAINYERDSKIEQILSRIEGHHEIYK